MAKRSDPAPRSFPHSPFPIPYSPFPIPHCSILALACLAVLCAAVSGCERAAPQQQAQGALRSFSGPTMGTRYNVTVVAPGAHVAELQAGVDKRLAEINRLMSTYDPDSELSRFNRHEGTDWFSVSEETAAVVRFALGVAEDSGGAFDPTVGPAVNLWGFGPDKRPTRPPSDEEVAAALERVGHQAVAARLDPPALRKSDPAVYVDLSAVAKGYASDEVSAVLAERGATASMVEIGGEVVTRGRKPGGAPWRIGVEQPESGGRSLRTAIELSDEALATSGDYRNFFEAGGVRYSHTIDPTTGRPVEHTLATVTVRAESCMEADALATALLVMGAERAYDWAEQRGVAALLVERAGDAFRERATSAWEEKSQAPEEAKP